MAEPTWTTRELPILEAVAKIEAESPRQTSVAEIATTAGLDEKAARLGFRALADDGYVTYNQSAGSFGGHTILIGLHLRGKGRRAIRQWPGDEPFQDLIDVLERLIAGTDEPDEKTRLEKVKAAVWGLGEKVGTAVAIAWGQSILGPPSR